MKRFQPPTPTPHRPRPPGHQPKLARGVWLPAGRHRAQLHPVGGGGQQRLPGRPAAWRPGGGHRGPGRDQPQHAGAHRPGPDAQDGAAQHRGGVAHRAGALRTAGLLLFA